LYRERAEASRTIQSLEQAIAQHPVLATKLAVCIYDNSPDPEALPTHLFGSKFAGFQPKRNTGLAQAYNAVLEFAAKRNIPWLLLLDSDTELTSSFLITALKVSRVVQENVAALVPHITERTTVHSPRFAGAFRRRAIDLKTSGIASREVIAINSGSVVRVSAVQVLGGFNTEFWLDYLDYWLFRSLQRKGYRIFVLPERLEHSLSFADAPRRMPLARYQNMLRAESYFTSRYGSLWESVRLKLVLLKRALRYAINSREFAFVRLTLVQLISWNRTPVAPTLSKCELAHAQDDERLRPS
jgi:GT2 family glycosyltransferase